jgi:hypothetical protein
MLFGQRQEPVPDRWSHERRWKEKTQADWPFFAADGARKAGIPEEFLVEIENSPVFSRFLRISSLIFSIKRI